MNRKRFWSASAFLIACGTFWAGTHAAGGPGRLRAAENPTVADDAKIQQLQEQIKQLQGLVPDQAAVMTHVGYHFTNLWAAIQYENWPLADFYLGETSNNIKWAIRAKPFRKMPDGTTVDLGAIAQALQNTQLAELKKGIAEKNKARCVDVYRQTLRGCYACHVASGKPYLKPAVPDGAQVKIINVDPSAKVAE